MKVRIEPVTVFPDTATRLELAGATIRALGETGTALIHWRLLNESGRQLQAGSLDLSGDSYKGWNDDDPYLMDIVLSQLGLTKV